MAEPNFVGGNDFVAVDIDGTIASKIKMGKYPDDYMLKTPLKGSQEMLRKIKRAGYRVMLFTARPSQDRTITEAWLVANGFSGLYDLLVMDKPLYVALIDDRNVEFTGDADKAFNTLRGRFLDETDSENK